MVQLQFTGMGYDKYCRASTYRLLQDKWKKVETRWQKKKLYTYREAKPIAKLGLRRYISRVRRQ